MAMKTTTIPCLILCFLLIFASEEIYKGRVEGALCRTRSRTFKGYCVSDRNCAAVCKTEGFSSGECQHHIRRRCYCVNPCR